VVLDLGCGDGSHRQIFESLGYRHHGVDIDGPAAHDLVDAHALPYQSETFALVASINVLEHLAQPHVVTAEVYRVLRPGAYFVGSVAFLEPFHGNSYLHMTHLGIYSVLTTAGFEVETVLCGWGWSVMRAQWEMAFGHVIPRVLLRALAAPFTWATRSYAWLGRRLSPKKGHHARAIVFARHAGSFFFIARKRLIESSTSGTTHRVQTPPLGE
jgi:SAM-dependent methyltransferase